MSAIALWQSDDRLRLSTPWGWREFRIRIPGLKQVFLSKKSFNFHIGRLHFELMWRLPFGRGWTCGVVLRWEEKYSVTHAGAYALNLEVFGHALRLGPREGADELERLRSGRDQIWWGGQ